MATNGAFDEEYEEGRPLDTHCTISPDGTMTGTLPNGSMWMTTPLIEGYAEGG